MRNKFKFFFCLFLFSLALSACVGPPSDQRCIPSDGSTTTGVNGMPPTNSPGSGSGSLAEEIDNYIRNGHVISTIVKKIKDEIVGDSGEYSSAQGIFNGFVNSPEYQGAIGAAFALFVIFYGLSVATGMTQVNLGDAVVRVAKIGFIATFAMNWDIFYNTIGSFFINGTDELIEWFMNNFKDLYKVPGGGAGSGVAESGNPGDRIFSGYDDLIARIFSFHTIAFVSALFNAGAYAPVYAVFLIFALWWVFTSVMKVVQIYIFSLFAKALLFAIAPIFLAFLLFQQTKPMFDAWVRQLVSFSLQPILVTAYIGLFSGLLTPFFDEFSQYQLCWNKLKDTSDYGWTFVIPGSANKEQVHWSPSSPAPISLQATLLFMFFAWLFKAALSMTEDLVNGIVQSAAGKLSDIEGLRQIGRLSRDNTAGITQSNLR